MSLPALEVVLAHLTHELAARFEERLSVRCMSRHALVGLVVKALERAELPLRQRPSAAQVLSRMEQGGLIRTVPIVSMHRSVAEHKFVILGFGADATDVHPFELLQAQAPQGVICFMAALQSHELTTQLTTHYHVAVPANARASTDGGSSRVRNAGDGEPASSQAKNLGTALFRFDGLPYYETRRERRYLAAVQTRLLNDSSQYRVTSLEQTLVDTLDRPAAAGGPAIIFEAWESALERLRPARIVQVLTSIGDARLTQRVGAMMASLGLEAEEVRGLLPAVSATPLSLVDNAGFERLDPAWNVLLP